jgi:hypothetical protein
VVAAALASAVVFTALTVWATQTTVRAVSPWQDDPYDVFVSIARVAVPLLTVVIALRLPVWRSPGGPNRSQQTVRAAGALTGLIGVVLVAEWAAVAARAHAAVWNGSTAALIAGLAGQSLLTLAAGGGLWRHRSQPGATRSWEHDWLGDVALLAGRLPVVRRWATPAVVAWVRRHPTAVFTAAAILGAGCIIGAQAIGERWTDPLLIGWAFTVEAATLFAFGVITNAVAGFIVRPTRTRAARVAETSVLAGTVALLLATALRDPLWTAFTGGPVGTVPALVTLTAGAGLAASALTAAVLAARSNGDDR